MLNSPMEELLLLKREVVFVLVPESPNEKELTEARPNPAGLIPIQPLSAPKAPKAPPMASNRADPCTYVFDNRYTSISFCPNAKKAPVKTEAKIIFFVIELVYLLPPPLLEPPPAPPGLGAAPPPPDDPPPLLIVGLLERSGVLLLNVGLVSRVPVF